MFSLPSAAKNYITKVVVAVALSQDECKNLAS